MEIYKVLNRKQKIRQTQNIYILQSTSNLCDAFSGKDSKIKSSSDLGWLDLALGGNKDSGSPRLWKPWSSPAGFCCMSFNLFLSFRISFAFRHGGLLKSAPLPKKKKNFKILDQSHLALEMFFQKSQRFYRISPKS